MKILLFFSLLIALVPDLISAGFLIGRGISDATGVIAEGILYGYANPAQNARGLHLRQFSRAFIVASSDKSKRVAIVVVEATMISQAVRTGVHEKLSELYGDTYTMDNVMLLPTHSHSCPGGFHTYLMYVIPSLGFVQQTYDAFVNGIVQSISKAHADLQKGQIFMNSGELLDASINRSPASYDNNPEEEKSKYSYNVDKDMTLLRFVDGEGSNIGMISFFAVHTTSMKNTNHLLSTDNKGYAAQMMERYLNPGAFPGEATIPAAFAQAAVGDVTPNTRGSLCEDTDEPCDYVRSSCPARPKDPTLCTGRGPIGDDFEDTKSIGDKQYNKAKELYEASASQLGEELAYVHTHVAMPEVTLEDENGTEVSLCRPAMGFSFAAGATDGPGIYPFTQGDKEGDDTLEALVKSVFPYPEEYSECHAPKPVLLPTGHSTPSWPWQPEIIPLQIFRIGDLILIGMPGEITTMSGRRVAETVKEALVEYGYPSTIRPLVLSMANGYTSYVTTKEEYMVQRYEGASTIFGPNTLKGYMKELQNLAVAMAIGIVVPPGPTPPDLRGKPPSAVGKIKTDNKALSEHYGDVLTDVDSRYTQGGQALATFRSGNPRNDMKTGSSYLEVQHQSEDGSWAVVATDAFWETKLFWTSDCHDVGIVPPLRCLLSQKSNVTITWDISANQEPGTYRLVHMGVAKTTLGTKAYTGFSSSFNVTEAEEKMKY